MKLHIFTFNPFAENTIVVANENGSCVIIDPGCYDQNEFEILHSWIQKNGLEPSKVLLTHAHLDHVFGLKTCCETYNIDFYMHALEQPVLDACVGVASMYGLSCDMTERTPIYLEPGKTIEMVGETWQILFAPGHSPGSVCFYHAGTNQAICGDVLFRDSIGRTDLPGGDHSTLLNSISNTLYHLPNETVVFPGHGPTTTIGYEKANNPFVRGDVISI